MDMTETRRLEMFVRVRDYGTAHVASFPASSFGGEQFASVGAVVDELTQKGATQVSSSGSARQGTGSRAVARAALREDLLNLTRTAAVMALDAHGLENKFRMPRTSGDQALLSTARAFVADAQPFKAQFIQHELSPNFLENLRDDIDALERAINHQNVNREAQISATAGIDSAIERGMNAVQRLDAIVRNKFHDNPAALAAWESARHVERPPRKVKAGNGLTDAPKNPQT